MKKILIFILVASALWACKTTEENYRSAYEKAIERRDSVRSLDQTIYGAQRRPMGEQTYISGTDTVAMYQYQVALTDGGGGVREWLRPFNVVVGQFKQKFNAVSMRERLVDAGYARTFVVQTGEPYYYVVLSSWPNRDEAAKALLEIPSDFPVPMKDPLPFILITRVRL